MPPAALSAFLIGAVIGRIKIAGQFAEPLLQLMRPISPVALVPLSIIWFGIGDLSRYFIIFYGVVIIMIMNTAAGVCRDAEHSSECSALPRRTSPSRFSGASSSLRRCPIS